MSMYIPWIIGVILAIVIVILSNSGIGKDKDAEPTLFDYADYDRFKKVHREWEQKQIAKLPLSDRLRKRGHASSHAYRGDNLHADVCFICGGSRKDGEMFCPKCQKLYENSPKVKLPAGITEEDRSNFWEFQQSIVVDLMMGKIDEATARREMDEVPGEIIRLNREHQEYQEQFRREKERREQQLQERLVLAERLSRK